MFDSIVEDEVSPSSTSTGQKRKAGPGGMGGVRKKQKVETDSRRNPLDMTCIHPESYHIATRFVVE